MLFALNGLYAIFSEALGVPEEAHNRKTLAPIVQAFLSGSGGGYIAGHMRLARFEGLKLVLDHAPPTAFIGTPDYSAYSRFHRLCRQHVAENTDPASLPVFSIGDRPPVFEHPRRACEDLTCGELTLVPGLPPPPKPFVEAFMGKYGVPGWFDCFYLYAAWRIQSDETLQSLLLPALSSLLAEYQLGDREFLERIYDRAREIARPFSDDVAGKSIRSTIASLPPPPTRDELCAYVSQYVSKDYPPPAWLLSRLHNREGLSRDVLVLLMQAVERQKSKKWLIVSALREKAAQYKTLLSRLADIVPPSVFASAAALALAGARPDDAEAYLLQETESAAILMALGDLQALQSHFLKAASFYHRAISYFQPTEEEDRRNCLHARAKALIGEAGRTEDEEMFNTAIETYQAALRLADPVKMPEARLALLAELGQHLLQFGRAAKGTDILEQAIDIFAEARALSSQEKEAAQWAELRHLSGMLHITIGNRQKSVDHWLFAAERY